MSVQQLITEHLDIWTAAHKTRSSAGRGSSSKLDLVGIKKLRELILELAVRGKLVPQDANDEPASELLKKIKCEKERLISEGKIKKQKQLPTVDERDAFFELPSGWVWERLNNIYDVRDGTHDTPKYQEAGYPLVTSKNLSSGVLDLSDVKFISEADHKKIIERSKVDKEDILFAMIGSIGNPVMVDIEPNFSIKNVALFKYYKKSLTSPSFLLRFLWFASVRMKEEASGAVQSFVSLGAVRNFIIALPPLAEQNRIVAKIDELMAFCDQLEQAQTNNIAAHAQLVEALLSTLVDSKDHKQLQTNWQRLATHFDTLFTTEHSIDQLKQTILQLAVMGKLVPQNPTDEPASELLKKIALEKEKLIKEGKIKIQKPLLEITEEEKPFELPEGWEWTRFANIFFDLRYGTSKKSEYGVDGVPILRIPNIVQGFVNSDDLKFSPLSESEIKELCLQEGDILIIRSNGSVSIVGRSAVVDVSHVGFGYAGYLVRVRFNTRLLNPYFLQLIMSSKLIRIQIEAPIRTTSGVKNINSTEIGNIVMPIIPIEEQHRIVAKVDELLALCDTLKTNLQTAQTTQLGLADALVESAIGRRGSAAPTSKPKETVMNIRTSLELIPTAILKSDAHLAKIIKSEGDDADADAKKVWQKSKLDLPSFYKQLKIEISAGYIVKPSAAEF